MYIFFSCIVVTSNATRTPDKHMPARTGVAVQNQNQLNAAQLAVLDAIQNTEGWNAGIRTTYHEAVSAESG